MPDRFDRWLITAGSCLHAWLSWAQGVVFVVIDEASRRVMHRRWRRMLDQRRRR